MLGLLASISAFFLKSISGGGWGRGTGLDYPKKLFVWKEELKKKKKKRKEKKLRTSNNKAN